MNENNSGTRKATIDRTGTPPTGINNNDPFPLLTMLDKMIEQDHVLKLKRTLDETYYKSQILEHFHPEMVKPKVSEMIRTKVFELNQLIDIASQSGLIVTLTGNGSVPGEITCKKHMSVKVKIQKIIEY